MKAYFEDGVDIGDLDALVRLGLEGGLSEHEARSALVLREGQDGVVAAERHASVLGITAVPTYVFNGQYSLSGAQEPSTLARVLDQVAGFAVASAAAP
jgi:predicted DsbA family dithiol-disulfide isomerase